MHGDGVAAAMGSPQFLDLHFHDPDPWWRDGPGREAPTRPRLPDTWEHQAVTQGRVSAAGPARRPGGGGRSRGRRGGRGACREEPESPPHLDHCARRPAPFRPCSSALLTTHFLFSNLGCLFSDPRKRVYPRVSGSLCCIRSPGDGLSGSRSPIHQLTGSETSARHLP